MDIKYQLIIRKKLDNIWKLCVYSKEYNFDRLEKEVRALADIKYVFTIHTINVFYIIGIDAEFKISLQALKSILFLKTYNHGAG